MGEPHLEYSGSASDGDWAHSPESTTDISHLEQGKLALTSAGSTLAGSPSTTADEADELMLSDFLLSLQANSGYAHMAMEASCTGAAPGAAAAVAHSAPRSLARRTTHAAGAGTAKSAAGRRTVVHRRKRRDDLAGPCNHCGALTSPQWRKGPKGKPVLCNACGIRFLRNRTLTKVMPKKRRHGAAGSKRSRAAAAIAMEGEEDDFPEDSMAAADEDMDEAYSAAVTAAATAAAQAAYAAALQPGGLQHSQQLLMQASMLAAANAAELYCTPNVSTAGLATASHAAAEAGTQAAGTGDAAMQCNQASDGTANKAVAGAAAAAPTMSAISRDSLFSSRSNSSRSLFAQLGDCPSLTLALALHQQQQQRRQQEEQEAEEEMQQQSSKYRLPNFPELQLLPPSSPPADSAATGFVCSPFRASMQHGAAGAASTYAVPAVSSPVCSSDSLLQLQHQCSSTTPPLSPLFLGAAGLPAAAAPVLSGAAAAGAEGAAGDMLQLVQQLGVALGGVGPAIEFLKLCSGNPAALAAAVAAVAASAAVGAR